MKKPCIKYLTQFFINVFVLFIVSSKTFATIYYVSSSGNDNNSGVTSVHAWKTLNKVNRTFLKPGDQVLFRRGDVWTGMLNIKTTGTITNQITFDAYGQGNNPVITGFSTINEWDDEGGGIFSKVINTESVPNLLTIDGVYYAFGRYPNNYNLNFESSNSNNSITDFQLSEKPNWTGAEVVIYKNEWTIEKCPILNHSENIITYSSQTISEVAKTGQYFIQNDIKTLDVFGEWFYNTSTKKIYVFFGSTDPTSLSTNIAFFNNLIKNTGGFDYINIKNIDLKGSNSSAVIFTEGTSNCTFTSCNISFSGGDGFTLFGNDNKIENCRLSKINGGNYQQLNGGGIFISGANAKIIGNSLTEIGIIPGQTSKIVLTIGITVAGDNSIIENNNIDNTAYMGIYITSSAEKSIIKFNRINRTGQLRRDSGGIYLGHDHPGTLITHNIISNAGGNGIYLDENCTGVTVSNNTIFASKDNGIKIHISSENIIKFNTIYDNPVGINFSNWTSNKTLYNNVVTDNLILAKPEQFVTEFISKYSGDKNFGSAERNYYVFSDYSNKVFAVNVIGDNSIKSFLNWKSFSRTDANSNIMIIKYSEGETDKLFYNNTNQSITFNIGKSAFIDVKGEKITKSFVLEPFSSIILIGKNFDEINQKPQISDQSYHIKAPKFKNDTIAQISAFDPDLSQLLYYSVYSNDDSDLFSIDSINGLLFVKKDIDAIKGLTAEVTVIVKDNSLNTLSDSAKILIFIEGTDNSPPVVTSFLIPNKITSSYIPIESIFAFDDIGIKGYYLSLTPEIPSIQDSLWSDSIPLYYKITQPGKVFIYAWVKDFADNISNPVLDSVIVNFQDLSATQSEYLFDENYGNYVFDTQSNNDGVIINKIHRGEGVSGNGLIFDGNGYLNLGKIYSENVSNQITISVWLKPELGNINSAIISQNGIYSNTFELLLDSDSARIFFITNGTLNASLVANNVYELWDGKWHHLAVTYDGNKKNIFLDGNIIAETKDSGIINPGFWNDLYIGAAINNKDTSFYHGVLDQINIYNYSKNEEDIGLLYHNVNKLLNAITIQEYVSICEGEDYFGWADSGEYSRILKRKLLSTSHADSTVITTLVVNPNYITQLETAICEGDTLTINGQKIFERGTFTFGLKSVFGCDSTLIIKLDILNTYYIELNKTICKGDTLAINNQKIFESGEYFFQLKTVFGCDSIILLNIFVNPSYQSNKFVTICEGDTYFFNNQDFNQSGTYLVNFETSQGCDSVVSLYLNVESVYQTLVNASICEGDTFFIHNQKFYEKDTYTFVLKSKLGCDSIVTLNLNVNPNYWITEEITILYGTNYKNWKTSGTYQQDFISINGCDSVVITHLKVIESFSQNILLEKGWNIFSVYVIPEQSDFSNIFQTLQREKTLINVLDENDNSYQKEDNSWNNNIGEFSNNEGYKIKVNTNCVLEITGLPVKLPLDIILKQGLNIISFPYLMDIDAMNFLNPLINQGVLKKVQDEKGNSIEYWGEQLGWINGIGNFISGEGYIVEVTENCLLTFTDSYNKSGNLKYSESELVNFNKKFEGNGSGHMNINLTGLSKLELQINDELAVFDGDKCVGAIKLNSFNIHNDLVSIKASISDNEIINGFTEGSKIDLIVWKAESNKEFRPKYEIISGKPFYQKHGSIFFNLISTDILFTSPLDEMIIFPNPFKNVIHIQFKIKPESETTISFSDLTGKKILHKRANSINENISTYSLPRGIYILSIISGEQLIIKKILKI